MAIAGCERKGAAAVCVPNIHVNTLSNKMCDGGRIAVICCEPQCT